MIIEKCYGKMIDKSGQAFEYSLERAGYSIFKFDAEFDKIAESRGWRYIECYYKQ